MKKIKSLLAIAIVALMLGGCGFNKNKDVLITVNQKAITQQDFDKAFNTVASNPMFAQLGVDLKADKNSFLYLMLKDRVVNELIVKSLLDQEIEKRKIKVTEDDVNHELNNIIDKIGTKEKFNEILKQNGVTLAQFRSDLKEEVKIKKLVDNIAPVSISDAKVEEYYKKNIDKFKYPDKVRASHILIMANPDEIKQVLSSSEEGKKLTPAQIEQKVQKDMNEKYAKASKMLIEVTKDPTKFAKLAKEHSDDTVSAQQGGDLGYFSEPEMVDSFSKVAFSMKPNTISDIVKTPYGYHIIMVTDRVQAGTEPLEKVKPEIKEYLENQEKVAILQKFVDTIKTSAEVTYKDPSYNPAEIQKQIKEISKTNPALMDSQKSAKE